MNNVISTITTYHGSEHRYLRDYQVRILGVYKNAPRPDYDPDAEADDYITNDEDLARAGG